jgi:hypothetical protein
MVLGLKNEGGEELRITPQHLDALDDVPRIQLEHLSCNDNFTAMKLGP